MTECDLTVAICYGIHDNRLEVSIYYTIIQRRTLSKSN